MASFLPHFDRVYAPHLGGRRESFRTVFRYLEEHRAAPYTLVETGTSHLPADPEGAAAHGHATVLFDRFVNLHGGRVYSVDIAPLHCLRARSLVSRRTRVACADGAWFLARLRTRRPIDCLYLDSGFLTHEEPDEVAALALGELEAALPLLAAGSLVLIDDSPEGGGRATLAGPVLERLGARPLVRDYQWAWELSAAPDIPSGRSGAG